MKPVQLAFTLFLLFSVHVTAQTLEYRSVRFGKKIVQYQDLQTFAPDVSSAGSGWYYLGPVAVSDSVHEQQGLIVKANNEDALAEVEDWEPVFLDIEGQHFSTWRGIAPDGYVVMGHFFVQGIEKPTAEQTAGIRAVRKDLTAELKVQRQIWAKRIPFDAVSLWDVVAVPLIFVPTGAFASTQGTEPGGLTLSVLRVNA